MAGCCCPRDYDRFFSKRFARSFAKKYRKRGLDKTSRKMADFLREGDIEGATVLEIGGGVGEIEIELLKAGAARAENLELSPAYKEEARALAEEAGVGGRIDWRLHNIAEDPEAVEPADIVVMHRTMGRGFRGFAHPPVAMLAVLEGRGLRQTYEHHGRIWQVAGHERAS